MILENLDPVSLLLGFAAGGVLGAFYFGGLWWTSRQVATARSPGLLFTGSFVLRMAVLLGGMYWVTRGRPLETALALVGVMIARQAIVARVKGGE